MRFDVRLRLLFMSILTVLPLCAPTLPALLLILCTAVLLLCLMRIPVGGLFFRLRKLFLLFFGLAILQSIFGNDGQTLLAIGSVSLLTVGGVLHSVQFFLRMVCIVLAGCLLFDCSTQEIAQGLHQLHLPYELCLLAMIGLKFIPILQEKCADTLLAMELRGISIQAQPYRKRLTLLSTLFMPTLVSSVFMAKQIATSLQVRGFRAQTTRSCYRTLQFARCDWIGLSCAVGYVVVFCVVKEKFL